MLQDTICQNCGKTFTFNKSRNGYIPKTVVLQ